MEVHIAMLNEINQTQTIYTFSFTWNDIQVEGGRREEEWD
jgi:hypothetical protein